MIQYALKCDEGHVFDSWFQSASAFEVLEKAGHLTCAVCGSVAVTKSLMAPKIVAKAGPTKAPMLSGAEPEVEQEIATLRRKVEESSDYVGEKFAAEARAMHEGDAPERSIYGQANLEEARALVQDGVPVMPLPFKPKQKLQ